MSLPLAQKHLFYTELAKLISAGFPIRDASAAMQDSGVPRSQAELLKKMESGLDAGETITEAFARNGADISTLERSIIGAGERGGRLAPAFQHLADYYGLLADARRQAINSMAYPGLLLHFAILVGASVPALAGKMEWPVAMRNLAISLVILYVVAGLLWIFVSTLRKSAITSASLDSALNHLPLIGPVRKNMAMARFTKVYHICVLAGLSISESARTASLASQSGIIRKAGEKLAATAQSGDKLGPQFVSSGVFPKAFARSYATAEESGGLDKDLERWAGVYQDNAQRSTQTLATFIPKAFYFLVVIFIVWELFSFYSEQFGEFDKVLESGS